MWNFLWEKGDRGQSNIFNSRMILKKFSKRVEGVASTPRIDQICANETNMPNNLNKEWFNEEWKNKSTVAGVDGFWYMGGGTERVPAKDR